MQKLRAGINAGVGAVEAVNIAEQHQQVSAAEGRHNGREGVVVPKDLVPSGLYLGGGYGVVFVHHGYDPQLQKGGKGPAQVLGPAGVLHVLAGEKYLGHGAVVLGKELIVNVHHPALAHCRSGLLHPKGGGPL